VADDVVRERERERERGGEHLTARILLLRRRRTILMTPIVNVFVCVTSRIIYWG
jgi:hypothetical protein